MILLDTDHATFMLQDDSEVGTRLRDRLEADTRPHSLPVVTAEEQLRGRLGKLARQRKDDSRVELYDQLETLLAFLADFTITPYTEAAERHFLTMTRVRIGTMDKKIASIALANSALLLTANSRDFAQIPGLRFADWTA